MSCQWLADWMIFLSSQTTPQEWAGSFLSPPKIRIYIYIIFNLTGILFLIYKHFNIYLNARLDALFIHIFNNLYRPIWNKRGWPRVFDATQPPQSSDKQRATQMCSGNGFDPNDVAKHLVSKYIVYAHHCSICIILTSETRLNLVWSSSEACWLSGSSVVECVHIQICPAFAEVMWHVSLFCLATGGQESRMLLQWDSLHASKS